MQGGYPAGSQPPDPNLPQPPDPQMQQLNPQPQQPVTLGQANGDPSGLPPGNPLLDQYTQAISGTLAALKQQGFMRDPVPPQPGPGILESLGTFGMANLKHIADENTRREENYRILQQNREIGMKGAEMATKMVDTQTAGGLAGARYQLALQGQNLQLQKYIHDLTEGQARDAHQKVVDHIKFDLRPAPKSIDEARMMRLQGWGESADNPGFWEKQQGGGGGGGAGSTTLKKVGNTWVDPNTPAGKALAATGGDTGGGAGTSNAPLPGEAPEDTADRIKRQNAIATKTGVPTSSTRTMSEMAPKVLSLADQVEQSMKRIKAGPLASRAQEFSAGTLGIGNAPFTKYRTDVGLLQTSLMRMHVGARGGEQMMQHFKSLLDAGKQSPENMQAALDEIRDYAKSMAPKDSATTDTPTSGGGPPSTLGGTKPTAATGSTPGDLNSLLKKHGY